MKRRITNKHGILATVIACLVLLTMLGLAACTSAPTPATTSSATSPITSPSVPTTTKPATVPTSAAFTINVSPKAGVGNYLVDSRGMTLYYFAKDSIGTSNATATTIVNWPVFNAPAINIPNSLNAADFATITRSDGQKQTTYKGWPLYFFAKDVNPADTLGEGVGGVWFVVKVPFYTVMLGSKTDVGNYLIDPKDMALYYFAKDSPGVSTASAAVVANWPPVRVDTFVVPSAMAPTDFTTIIRPDGTPQSAYKSWPLYYYIGDKAAGDTNGQGLNNVWYVINPANFPPTAPPAATTTPAATTPATTTATQAAAPSLTITTPVNGATVTSSTVVIGVSVTNFNVVDQLGSANVAGQGHVRYFLDASPPAAPGVPPPPVTAPANAVPSAATTYTWTNLSNGAHTLYAELINNDNTSLVPPVIAKVSITVSASSGAGGGY